MRAVRIYAMIDFDYSIEKNQLLKETRGIGFEEIIAALKSGCLLDTIEHPNKNTYPNQEVYVVNIEQYVYLVPFVKKGKNGVFLKTIFPDRKMTKRYLGER
jgi:hypothetical protein